MWRVSILGKSRRKPRNCRNLGFQEAVGEKNGKGTHIGLKWRNQDGSPTCRRVVAAVDGKSRRVRDWLSSGFLSACRSGGNEPNGGVVSLIWSSCWKSLLENFFDSEEV